MRCQFVLPDSDELCVKAGMFPQQIPLANGDRVLVMLCRAHEQAVGAVQWAERQRERA